MRRFRLFALAGTAATYFLIFVGGLVRVAGAGLGCPDWPKCFGRWFPPTSISQLPPDIDPATFNFALAWIEYVNRLIGMTVGLLIGGAAIWALVSYRRYPKIVIPAAIAGVMVAYQGWQGGQVVSSELEPLLVSVHMGLAFIIAALMLYVTLQAWYLEREVISPGSAAGNAGIGNLHWQVAGLSIIAIIQIISGSQVRTALELVAEAFPQLPQSEWLSKVGAIHLIHTGLGVILALATWKIGSRIVRATTQNVVVQGAWAAMLIAAVQLLLGAILTLAGMPGVLRLFHLLLSSLYVGMIVLLYSALHREGRKS